MKILFSYHDGLCGGLLGASLPVRLLQAFREPFHITDRQQHGSILGFHRQHLALGVQGGNLLLVTFDLLGQLLFKIPQSPIALNLYMLSSPKKKLGNTLINTCIYDKVFKYVD